MQLRSVWILLCFVALCGAASLRFPAEKAFAHENEAIADIAAIKSKIRLSDAERQWINKHEVVRVRVGQWPPFMMTAGGVAGISIDYLDIVSRVHGIRFARLTEKDLSWPQTLQYIRERRVVDMVPAIQPTPERRSFMAFSGVYRSAPWVIVTREDAEFVGGMEDLAGRTVSVQKGFVLQKTLERECPKVAINIIDTAEPTLDALKAVASGQVAATINALPVVAYFIREYGLSNLKIAAPAGFKDLELAMGVRGDWPELASILTKTFAAMSERDVAAINNIWLSPQYEYGVSPRTVLMWGVGAAAGVAVLILLFTLVGAALKRQVAERTRALERELRERIRAEEALQESEARFRFLVENSPLPMLLTDGEGVCDYMNKRFVEEFGYTLDDCRDLETGYRLAFPDPDYRAEVVKRWDEATQRAKEEGGPIRGGEFFFTRRDGSVRIVDIMGMPVGDKAVTVFIDQTNRKKAEELMVQTEKMLSVGGLAAGMAHEINNPLGIILASVQNLKRRVSPEFRKNALEAERCGVDLVAVNDYLERRGALRFMEAIREAGERASRIVRNMLDFSRKGDSRRERRNVNAVLDKAVELAATDYDLKKKYDFKQLDVVREYAPEPSSVPVVETEIEQVFFNILKNAAQALAETPHEGRRGRIVLRTREEKNHVVVEIEDNGPGMGEQERKRVFEPFFTTKSPGGGVGLGLSVSYFIIAQNHAGEIEIRSTPGEGTAFVVRLPKDDSENARDGRPD